MLSMVLFHSVVSLSHSTIVTTEPSNSFCCTCFCTSIRRFIFIVDLKYQQDIFSLLVHLFKECMHFFTGITSFYAELMRGIGASARIWELTDRVPQIPITGGCLMSPSMFL